MSDNVNPTEERAIDVLLSEACGAKEPPDLMREIVARLDDRSATENQFVAPVVSATTSRSKRRASRRWTWAPLLIAVAASLLLVVWIGGADKADIDQAPQVAQGPAPMPLPEKDVPEKDTGLDTSRGVLEKAISPPTSLATDDTLTEEPNNITEDDIDLDDLPTHDFEPANVPAPAVDGRRGVALAGGTRSSRGSMDANDRPAKPVLTRQPVQLVSRRVDQGLRDYWKSLGVKPTGDAAVVVVASRVESALGVSVSPAVLMNFDQLRSQLARPSSAKSIASSWLDELTMNGFRRMGASEREQLLDVFADAIVAGKGFDRAIVGLVSGKRVGSESASEAMSASEAWYNAMGSHGEAAMRSRVAAVTMNADLRCIRCHDAKVSSRGSQEDYWSFAAVLRTQIQQRGDGGWKLRPPSSKQSAAKPIFFDLLDGRRRLVEAGVPPQWMGPQWTESPSSIDVWAEDLVGSRAMAKGIVNSLWKTLLGRPLIGSPVDGLASPPSESLVQLEREFCDDLIASDFDVARTLVLMLRSSAMRRNIPEVLTPEKSLLANREQLAKANLLVSSFAAAAPERRRVVMHRKIAFVLRAAGLSIDSGNDGSASVLSQADDPRSNAGRGNQSRSSDLPQDFPSEGDELPVQWLDSLGDFNAKVEHLAYLSGRSRVPISIAVTTEAMGQANTNETLTLQRLWWALSK